MQCAFFFLSVYNIKVGVGNFRKASKSKSDFEGIQPTNHPTNPLPLDLAPKPLLHNK